MCLEHIEEVYDDYENDSEIEGYQAKCKHGKENYHNELINTHQTLSMNEWEESLWNLSWVNPKTGLSKYRPGFHIWRTIEAARRWADSKSAIVRVKGKGILAKGEQDKRDVVVCREIKIVEEMEIK